MLNLKEMLIGMPVRLRYVDRFSTCRVIRKESVAEHSFYVAFYSLMIAWWVENNHQGFGLGAPLNTTELLTKALLHDIDEAATGDIPRFFKYSDSALKDHLDVVALQGVTMIAEKLWAEPSAVAEFTFDWKEAKCDTPEGRILEFADFLSVLLYAAEEIRSSNFTMREHLQSMVEYYEKFTTKDFDFIQPLVEEARKILFGEVLLNGA